MIRLPNFISSSCKAHVFNQLKLKKGYCQLNSTFLLCLIRFDFLAYKMAKTAVSSWHFSKLMIPSKLIHYILLLQLNLMKFWITATRHRLSVLLKHKILKTGVDRMFVLTRNFVLRNPTVKALVFLINDETPTSKLCFIK